MMIFILVLILFFAVYKIEQLLNQDKLFSAVFSFCTTLTLIIAIIFFAHVYQLFHGKAEMLECLSHVKHENYKIITFKDDGTTVSVNAVIKIQNEIKRIRVVKPVLEECIVVVEKDLTGYEYLKHHLYFLVNLEI